MMRLQVATAALLACAACDRGATEPPKRVNIEVTGSAECLGSLVSDLDLRMATTPVFTDNIGRMEFGPIEATEFPKVVDRLRAAKCVQVIRQLPCTTPLSDIDWCNAPVGQS